MSLAKAVHCDGCYRVLRDYQGRQIPGQLEYTSSITGSNATLCKHCSNCEDEEIYKIGTNNIPHLLKLYKSHKY